jgi:hypothetical protein
MEPADDRSLLSLARWSSALSIASLTKADRPRAWGTLKVLTLAAERDLERFAYLKHSTVT